MIWVAFQTLQVSKSVQSTWTASRKEDFTCQTKVFRELTTWWKDGSYKAQRLSYLIMMSDKNSINMMKTWESLWKVVLEGWPNHQGPLSTLFRPIPWISTRCLEVLLEQTRSLLWSKIQLLTSSPDKKLSTCHPKLIQDTIQTLLLDSKELTGIWTPSHSTSNHPMPQRWTTPAWWVLYMLNIISPTRDRPLAASPTKPIDTLQSIRWNGIQQATSLEF